MIQLANRLLLLTDNPTGIANAETTMQFGAQDSADSIGAIYAGPNIASGHALIGGLAGQQPVMLYHAISTRGELSAGRAVVVLTEHNGKLQMQLNWKWISGNSGQGVSHWQE